MTGRARDPGIDAAVLAATLAELREVPYQQLSIERVAAAAGVAKTSVYRRWPSKVALVGNAILTAVAERIEPTRDGGGSAGAPPAKQLPAEQLLAASRQLRDLLAEPHLRRAVAGLLADAEDSDLDPLRERLLGLRTDVPGNLAGDLASDAVTGAILYRSLVMRLPVEDAYLVELVELVTGRPASDRRQQGRK
ncbi:MAG TPA: TetR/AcrR family transcriptional regulator [Mycobacteriales bacterium]|jgi:AcrR family transcriptional regulator|nr:TetR/AcrR family transcriptional regulator [Mycobacteriales bacterium]